MRNKKFQLYWYQANDTAAMERKLEKMAEKGWLLEKVTNWGWFYRRAEPQAVKYTVTFFPDASVFDGAPTAGQETYADYCAAAGWEFVSAFGPMQFFRSTRPDPTPIETDEGEKLQAIHKSMLKTWVLGYGLLTVSALLSLTTRIKSLQRNTISELSSNGNVAMLILTALLLVYLLALLADYFIWHHRSQNAVERGEACLQPHTRARLWASAFLLAACALSILAWAGEISGPGTAFLWLYAFGGMAAVIGLSGGVMALMKKQGCSRKATRTGFIIACFLLSSVYTGSTTRFVTALRDAGLTTGRQPAYVHTTSQGGEDIDWDIYRDELPITLEDLGYTVTEADHCSYVVHREKSVLMDRTTYVQKPYGEDSTLPDLRYTVAEVKWGFLLEPVLRLATEGYYIDVGGISLPMGVFFEVDEPLFGADRMYAPDRSGTVEEVYLVYGNRIFYLQCYDGLTDDQIAAIVEKLDLA